MMKELSAMEVRKNFGEILNEVKYRRRDCSLDCIIIISTPLLPCHQSRHVAEKW